MTMNRKKHIITIAGAGRSAGPALVGNLIEMKERFPLLRKSYFTILIMNVWEKCRHMTNWFSKLIIRK